MAGLSVSSNKYKVIIIGSGIAGLSAAKHLVKNNMMDFIMVEAKDKIGGRIMSTKLGSIKVEVGANWIHGVLGNPMYEIAMTHGLINVVHNNKPHKVVAATEDGKQVPFAVLQEIYGAYMCFLHRCEEYFLCQYIPPEGIHSVGEHINLEIAIYLERIEDSRQRRIRQLIFQCLLKRETCISGCDSMNEIDLLELGSYTELQGGNIVLPSGYSSILSPVAQDIPQNSVLLNHPVTEIRWQRDSYNSNNTNRRNKKYITVDDRTDTCSVLSESSGNESDDSGKTVIDVVTTVDRRVCCNDSIVPIANDDSHRNIDIAAAATTTSSLDHDDEVEVLCQNGTKFVAEHVICTLPLGVLKQNARKIFVPSLPDYKVESMEKLLFGTVDKIFLAYDRPFLNPDISEVLLLWEMEPENKSNDVEDDLSKTWFRKIYSFSKVTETVLLGWISGREAVYMESLPEQVIAETCTTILRKFLSDPFIPKPKFVYCSKWHSDKYTSGSYTAIAVGSSQADIERVAQPIYSEKDVDKPILLFGGEHTHNNFYSTVHGAYLSGRTAAQLVLDSCRKPETVLQCDHQTSDLSAWVRAMSLQ